ncbi:23S rRNA (adenine2030-N6)-methyltransferase [Parvibaculum indicum]|uniref:23S rRNA (adenine(2030)-N(6))-methyltransferase RlmJ n=1 Tax=Parvibaculum indicum TaxID=562969 RepID=UPI00142458C2|nr:23S rRNA (adenine(2030)-N(6))-methyltransferase RlmJ [Parvibaculum indicum]NIJ41526.1 23S rRNA (adenine2030-N6)-methyltransferase [Parvibaculum indicum]
MNYRHEFHAGNFADVMKHALLTLSIEHLKKKAKPFFLLDTHAGAGMTDLAGEEAQKTGEFRQGIARLLDAEGNIPVPLAPYLEAVRALGGDPLTRYPGSPALAAYLARSEDRIAFVEIEQEPGRDCAELFKRDPRVKVQTMDGYRAMKAMLPPKERRGLILVDPPFEDRAEFATIEKALAGAHRRWATGTLLVWYPVKDPSVSGEFLERMAASGIPKQLALELHVMAPDGKRMTGSGILAVNPPWPLANEGEALLDWLAEKLAQGPGARARVEWLAE